MLLDGKLVSNKIKEDLKLQVEEIKKEYNCVPSLAVVIVGNNKASEIYVRNKVKACESVGIKSIVVSLDEMVSQKELNDNVKKLNDNKDINGIIIQLPLPKGLDGDEAISLIDPKKDVDGLTKESVANLIINKPTFIPCTPKGVVDLLDYYKIEIEGKEVAIVGRSMLVGKPLSLLFTNRNATVTLCHSKTKNLKRILKRADIVVAAIGKAKFIKKNMIKRGSIVVDVGINRVNDLIVGDVDYDRVKNKASYITPVPGGCGKMTVAELLSNTIKAFYYNK